MGTCVVLNGERINYDGVIDYQILDDQVLVYENSQPHEIIDRIQNAEVVVTKELPLPKEIIKQFPDSVKLIVEAGTGYNNIDLDACNEKGIKVCNIPAYSTQRVAHTTWMLILNLFSSMGKQLRMIERKDYRNFHEHLMVSHTEINEKTLGIIGAGAIGKEVMKIARVFGMNVLVYTRTMRANEEGITYTDLDTVLKESDVISLHCPLNEKTYHIIDEDALSLIKPTAFLVNTARGALIDEVALIKALKEKRIQGAGLDVQEVEPLAYDSPLYEMEEVILTPHIGWRGLETRLRLVEMVKEDIDAYYQNNLINVIV